MRNTQAVAIAVILSFTLTATAQQRPNTNSVTKLEPLPRDLEVQRNLLTPVAALLLPLPWIGGCRQAPTSSEREQQVAVGAPTTPAKRIALGNLGGKR
jgi:hypothetical protein